MDPITLLTLASLGVNLAGNIAAKPKKNRFDPMAIYRALESGELQNLEALTAGIRQSASQTAAGRGLTGGAAAQVVAQAEAPARAQASGNLARSYAQLVGQKQMLNEQDRQANRQWLSGMFGDVAGGLGAYAAGLQEQKSIDALIAAYDQSPVRTSTTANPFQSKQLFPGMRTPGQTGGANAMGNAGTFGLMGKTHFGSNDSELELYSILKKRGLLKKLNLEESY